jgi:predicted O-methyltransferase YrrM
MFVEPELIVGANDLAGQRIQPTVGKDAASLLDLLVRLRRPQRILEIGTSYGYAACALGLAARDYGGKATTIEINPALADAAKKNVAALGLTETVCVITGDAKEIVTTFREPFGLILQDGGKMDYLPLLDRLVNLLEPGGLLITDDILFPVMDIPESARAWQIAMAEYNIALGKRKDLRTVWLPMGDGVAVSIKS